MKIVHSWLQDLAPVGDDVESLAASMTALGMQVEDVAVHGATVAGVVTARVLRTERHPDAAKVHRVWVDTGDGHERHVWCGAFNMAAGDVVPLALPGTTMPDGRLIEPRPILGIESQGMLCSPRELGLGDDHSGIMILAGTAPLGVGYGEALGLATEVVFDVDLTRNRPDCWGHLGVARDLAAHLHVGLHPGPGPLQPEGPERSAPVELVDGERCPRFTTVVLSGIRVGPSPDWVARRLRAAGMRPINNVVDVSNFVMLELNQPNHAYDLEALGGGGLRIRLARDGEVITTLDEVERRLTADDLLICDALDAPVGIGGVMGGLGSEITAATTTVALEMAVFEQTAMTRTMNRLALRTEASGRFERGVDAYGIERAQARFVELLRLTCPDLVVHAGAVDARHGSLMPRDRSTVVRVAQVNRILGTDLDAAAIAAVVGPIGFQRLDDPSSGDGTTLTVALPSWRTDAWTEIDVVEEVARHVGYATLGTEVPRSPGHGGLSHHQRRRRLLRDVLLGLGASEAITETFLREPDVRVALAVEDGAPLDVVRITNPLQADEDVLRPTLRVGMLRAIAFNESHRRPEVALFELGHVYPPGDRSGELPAEFEALAVALAGQDATAAVAVWREISAALGVGARLDQSRPPAGLHPGRSATLTIGRDVVGALGEVHPDVCEAFGVGQRVAWLELDAGRLLRAEPKVPQWRPVSRFPSTDLDLAFSVPEAVPAERVDKAIRTAAGNLLVDLRLFDVYRGHGTPEGTRSLAFRLRLQAAERTLTDADVAAVREKVVSAVAKSGAVLRG